MPPKDTQACAPRLAGNSSGPQRHLLRAPEAAAGFAPPCGSCDRATLQLAPTITAAGEGRGFARRWLSAWGLPKLESNLSLVLSELLSNAVRHGECGGSSCPYICVELLHGGGSVLCSVTDGSTRPPVAREPDTFAEGGRGLIMVAMLSVKWGWTLLDSTGEVGGKQVWALLQL